MRFHYKFVLITGLLYSLIAELNYRDTTNFSDPCDGVPRQLEGPIVASALLIYLVSTGYLSRRRSDAGAIFTAMHAGGAAAAGVLLGAAYYHLRTSLGPRCKFTYYVDYPPQPLMEALSSALVLGIAATLLAPVVRVVVLRAVGPRPGAR